MEETIHQKNLYLVLFLLYVTINTVCGSFNRLVYKERKVLKSCKLFSLQGQLNPDHSFLSSHSCLLGFLSSCNGHVMIETKRKGNETRKKFH